MGLCTPCAGTRPGAADPPRSRAANPPPRLASAFLAAPKNRPKIYLKSIRNQSKIDQNRPKIEPGGTLDSSWAAPGSKTSPRRFQTLPGCLLGGSWAALGRKTWPTWLQLGSLNGAKMVQKSIKISIIFWMPLGIDFATVFN